VPSRPSVRLRPKVPGDWLSFTAFRRRNTIRRHQKDLSYAEVAREDCSARRLPAKNRERADFWAALMCDAAAREGWIEPTPLCLLFG
jgi:hypothetical protein